MSPIAIHTPPAVDPQQQSVVTTRIAARDGVQLTEQVAVMPTFGNVAQQQMAQSAPSQPQANIQLSMMYRELANLEHRNVELRSEAYAALQH